MPHTLTHSQTTEYRATQLLYSIQFKLSHAIAKGGMVLAEIGEPLLVEFYLWALIPLTRESRYMNPNIRW